MNAPLGLAIHGWTRGRPLLAVEESAAGILLVELSETGDVVTQVQGPRSGNLQEDLEAGLNAMRQSGRRPPRTALLVTDRATAACLELPALANLPEEEAAGLVRFELEPLLPAPASGGLACSWARGAAGAVPGTTLVCGLPSDERDELAHSFRRAGLRLQEVYASGSCGAALAGPLSEGTVCEAGPDGVSLARLQGGQVVQLRSAGSDPQLAAHTVLDVADPAMPLVVLGPVDDDLLERLQGGHADVQHQLSELAAPPSLLGAALHTLQMPAGDRVAGVSGRPPRVPLAAQPALWIGALVLLLLASLAGADALSQQALSAALANRDQAKSRADQRRIRAAKREELRAQRDDLQEELKQRAAEKADAERGARRGQELVQLMEALGDSVPEGVLLDGLDDGASGVVVRGSCYSPTLAQTFLKDLEAALASRSLTTAWQRVERDERTYDGYRFEARFERVEK